jgi:hypothetical protein
MFSNLASYIFGSTVENEEPELPQVEEVEPERVPEKVEEEEWVLVGDGVPALTLGSLTEVVLPRSALGSTGSSDPSLDSEDSGDAPMQEGEHREVAALTRTARRLTVPFGSISGPTTSLSDIKCVRAAQSLKVKDCGKHLSSKALDRRNKAVKQQHGGPSSRKSKAPTMSLKASGSSRHLKQC